MPNDDIKDGDPKLRAFVDLAIKTGRDSLAYATEAKVDDTETDLIRAAVVLLEDWRRANAPYHMQHVLNFATALNGFFIAEFQYTRQLEMHIYRAGGLMRVEVQGTDDFDRAVSFAARELEGADWKHETFEDRILFTEFPVEG